VRSDLGSLEDELEHADRAAPESGTGSHLGQAGCVQMRLESMAEKGGLGTLPLVAMLAGQR